MIIKSMSRKVPSFGQLIEYMSDIDKSDEQYNIYQNIYARNSEDIEQEFKQNAETMFKRKMVFISTMRFYPSQNPKPRR